MYVDVHVMFGPVLSQRTISFLLIKIVFWKGITVVKVKIIVHKLYWSLREYIRHIYIYIFFFDRSVIHEVVGVSSVMLFSGHFI